MTIDKSNRKLVHIHPDYAPSDDRRGVPVMENSWALAESMQHWAGGHARWVGFYPVVLALVGLAFVNLTDIIASGFGGSAEELLWRLALVVVGFGAGLATLAWKLGTLRRRATRRGAVNRRPT